MRLSVVVLVASVVACGGNNDGETDAGDGGFHISRGVPGTGPADLGGVWALGLDCSSACFTQCPFQNLPDRVGTCYKNTLRPTPFCGVAPNQQGFCPAGTAIGTAVEIPGCVKFAATPAECPPYTNFFRGFCIYF